MPYNKYSDFLKKRFESPVRKISIDAGFTCPNRDGSKGYGGCTFCNNQSFTPINSTSKNDIQKQISDGIQFFQNRRQHTEAKFLAYFQSFTNTYKPVGELREIYQEALAHPEVVGIVIGTRPDCLEDEVLDLLEEIAKEHSVTLEIGIETTSEITLRRIQRRHTFLEVQDAFQRAMGRGIDLGGHLIIGLPGETKEDFLRHAKLVSQLPIDVLKVHQLQVVSGTVLSRNYQENPRDFQLFEKDDYVEFMCEFVSHLRPDLVVERISSQSPEQLLIAPRWGVYTNNNLMQQMAKRMIAQGQKQGDLYGI